MTPRVLVIAGSDSGGGAGIQADIKTAMALGGYATTAITAITAQNTQAVVAAELVPTALVIAQIDAVLADIGADAVKIGMIGSAATAHAVADRLDGIAVPIVFDPVMVATSGAALADAETIAAFERLMTMATVITPNLPELAVLSSISTEEPDQIIVAARAIAQRHASAVLAKGGHGLEPLLIDRLVGPHGLVAEWSDERIVTRHTHGTGCTLATAVATGLASRLDLPTAITAARCYLRAGILAAPGLGRGHGPINHLIARQPTNA